MILKWQICFIGSSAVGLQKLIESSLFLVTDIFCLESRLNESLVKQASLCGLIVKTFKWISDFRKLIIEFPSEVPFFIYQLDMLVPKDLTEKFSFYNVHRGNLYTNRGPNPDVWPILNGDKQTSLSLHKINDKIDSGILIDAYNISIDPDDDTASVKGKLEEGLPQLIISLNEYLSGQKKGIELAEGVYKPWITEADFTIDPAVDNLEIIERKIKSQCQYNGAIFWLNNKKYYILSLIKKEKPHNLLSTEFIDGDDAIHLSIDQGSILLIINKSPECPPPPIFPKALRI